MSLSQIKCKVQSDVCRSASCSLDAKEGKKQERKNVEKKIWSLPDEGREFISETPFDFPGRNPFEESHCSPSTAAAQSMPLAYA